MEIYLIRHGASYECTFDQYDESKQIMNPALTQKGKEQAEQLGLRLGNIRFNKIYTSDSKSAVETTEIMNNTINSDIELRQGFREIHMGDIYEKSWGEYPELFAKWALFEEDIPYPGGENGANVWERCKKELETIITSEYERVAIVSHQGTIQSLICGMLKLPQDRRHCLGEPIMHTSISVLKYTNKKYLLHSFNDCSHLQ